MGLFHAENISQMNDACLYALCDLDEEKLDKEAKRLNEKKYTLTSMI